MIWQVLAAFFGTIAFSLLFHVPKKYYLCCGITGGAGWLCYAFLAAYTPCTMAEATFFAAVVVVLLSRGFAVWDRCPATVFLISGIFPLVPGAGIYWTAYYLVTDQTQEAFLSGFTAMKAVVAIVLGILVVFALPQRLFLPGRRRRT